MLTNNVLFTGPGDWNSSEEFDDVESENLAALGMHLAKTDDEKEEEEEDEELDEDEESDEDDEDDDEDEEDEAEEVDELEQLNRLEKELKEEDAPTLTDEEE